MGVSGLYTQQVGWMRTERPALSPPAPQEPVTEEGGVVVVYMGQSQIPTPHWRIPPSEGRVVWGGGLRSKLEERHFLA